MTDASDYLGSEGKVTDPEDGLYAKTKYKYSFRCAECGGTFSRIYTSAPKVNPDCPKKACKDARTEREIQARAENMARILEEGRAPGIIGANPLVRAVDKTSEWAMQDYNLTDLKSSAQTGDTIAPSLPHKQQQMADNFFGATNAMRDPISGVNVPTQHLNRVARRAIAGSYAGRSVSPTIIAPSAKPGEKGLVLAHTHKA